MTKGGFLAEVLASRKSTSDVGYLSKFLYYAYIAIPLATIYWAFITGILLLLIFGIIRVVFPEFSDKLLNFEDDYPIAGRVIVVGLTAMISVMYYHLGLLGTLLVPVKMLLNI